MKGFFGSICRRVAALWRLPVGLGEEEGRITPLEALAAFGVGCGLYPLIEILWRGYTHYSMALAGGIGMLLLYCLYLCCARGSRLLRALASACLIATVEFCFGLLFNLTLHCDVWDYSHMRFQLLGQVCLLYFCLWGLLSFALDPVLGGLYRLTHRKKCESLPGTLDNARPRGV